MLILDKAQAIDRMITASAPVQVPEQFVRQPHRIATFERVDVPVGIPALVLAPEPEPLAVASAAPAEPSTANATPVQGAPARVFAWRVPQSLGWPVFSFALARQSDS